MCPCVINADTLTCICPTTHSHMYALLLSNSVTVCVSWGYNVVKRGGICEVAILPFYCTSGSCWKGQGALWDIVAAVQSRWAVVNGLWWQQAKMFIAKWREDNSLRGNETETDKWDKRWKEIVMQTIDHKWYTALLTPHLNFVCLFNCNSKIL